MVKQQRTIVVRNSREAAHYQRQQDMYETAMRNRLERAEAAYSEYLTYMGAMCGVAEDITVEALKFFVPSPAEQKQIKKLPKHQRKKYLNEHWPYYRNETKQMFDSIDTSWFENMLVQLSRERTDLHLERLQELQDRMQQHLQRHMYILRQGVKRWLGRLKDANGNHLDNTEQLSYLYVACMMWQRVCSCHDLRVKLGATPIGTDFDDECRQYLMDFTRRNHELTSQGKPSEASRYYDPILASKLHPYRPTRIRSTMDSLVQRLIGCFHDPYDPKCADIAKSDEIILSNLMARNVILKQTNDIYEEETDSREEYKILCQYMEETNREVRGTPYALECIAIRVAGKTPTELILKWLLEKHRDVGYQKFAQIRGVLEWLDKRLPPVEPPKTEQSKQDIKDMQALDQLMELVNSDCDKETFIQRLDEICDGDEAMLHAFAETLDELNTKKQKRELKAYLDKEHERQKAMLDFARWREQHPEQPKKQPEPSPEPIIVPAAEPTTTPSASPTIDLTPQPPEPRIRRERWSDDDAAWLLKHVGKGKTTIAEAAVRLGRTELSIRSKLNRLQARQKIESKQRKPLHITKAI